MASVDELGRLIGELRRISSPVQRVKLLARAWRSIQRLDPGDRRKLAKQVGVDGAENLIERMAVQKGRVGPALIQRALDKVRETDPDQLKSLLQGLRDPVRRAAMIERGLSAITAGADEPQEPAGPPPESESEPEPEPELKAEPPPPVETVEAEPEPLPPPPPPPPPRQQVTAEEPPRYRAACGLVELIEKEQTLIRRFRVLNTNLNEAEDSAMEDLERLLALFPGGWARRRALAALLREGIPADDRQAAHLIESLESPVSRRWCRNIISSATALRP